MGFSTGCTLDFEGVEVWLVCGVEWTKFGDAGTVSDADGDLSACRAYPVKSAVRVSASIANDALMLLHLYE